VDFEGKYFIIFHSLIDIRHFLTNKVKMLISDFWF